MADFKTAQAAALVIDGHADTPQRFLDGWDFTAPLGTGMLNLESARQGGLAAQFFALWVDPEEHPLGTHAARAQALLDATVEQVRRHPDELAFCTIPSEILDAREQGKFAMLLAIEGGHAIENSLEKLRSFHRQGVRYMTLTWSFHNDWADSSGEPPRHHGLTDFGRDVIREMNRLGMMIDVSHVSDETFWHVIETTGAPIAATHSNARALTNVPRNLTDDQIKAIAQNGGIVMVNFYPGFLSIDWRNAWEVSRPERKAMHEERAKPYRERGQPVPFSIANEVDRLFAARIPRPPLSALIDHIQHIVRVAGIDHVGLGSDFDGIPALPLGLKSAADLPKITDALSERGFTAGELQKLLGGNLLRVLDKVQRLATSPR
jgi:membrane dipeptidase